MKKSTKPKPTEAMTVCAHRVRMVSNCSKCLHFDRCAISGTPVSETGRLAAKIALLYLPYIESQMQEIALTKISFALLAVRVREERRGAMFAIRMIFSLGKGSGKNALVRVPVFANDDRQRLFMRCFCAYFDKYRKFDEEARKDRYKKYEKKQARKKENGTSKDNA